jgi:uncharacterized repeat protein (TIGR01451 family)
MKRFHDARFILNAIVALVLMASLGLVLAPGVAEAAEEPEDCLNNCFSLDILKDKSAVHNHEYITYTVCAANNNGTCPSPCNMEGVTINLTLPSNIDGTATGTLVPIEPGRDFPANGSSDRCYNASEFYELVFYVDVPPGVTSITARADYAGSLMDGPPDGDPSASFKTLSVSLLKPCVNVTKTADTPFSKVGDNITYTIKVCNCGDSDLTKVSIIDDKLGILTGSFAATLLEGNCESHTFTHTVTASDPNPLVNEVEVIYEDYTAYAVNATAGASVPLVHPSIKVTKTVAPTTSKAGDNVTYTITLNNTSPDANLENITVGDSILGPLSASFADALAHGATETHTFQYTIKASDPDPLVNNVTVHANPVGLPNDVTDKASATVNLVYPGISCNKTASPTSGGVGTVITYTIKICNTGDVDLTKTSVIDSLLGNISGNFSPTLTHGTCESHNFTRTIGLSDYPGPIQNTVDFTYTVPGLGNVVKSSCSASVDLNKGNLRVFKYIDLDGDGVYQPGAPDNEYGLGDWHFTVTGPKSYDGNTNGSGYLLFSNIPVGHYVVTETLKTDWVNSDPGGVAPYKKEVDVVAGQTAEVIFGNWAPLGCLQICKYEDANVNGMWDPGEEYLPDWRFHVTGNGYDKWVKTGADGCVQFKDLIYGDYTVTEELKAGWYNTWPGGDPPYQQMVTVTGGKDCVRVEFGNREEIKDVPPMIPAMNQWGIIAMIAVFVGLLVWMVRRKRLAS